MRALVIGAGRYPYAKVPTSESPALADLTSVGPSVRKFLRKLLVEWKDDLVVPLESVELLLSETAQPGGSVWETLGVAGEAAVGTGIEEPTLQKAELAFQRSLDGAGIQDHFLFLCCGHGFWKAEPCFVLSDFNENRNNPWSRVIALRQLSQGLRQKKPRSQWLFCDCCSDIPPQILNALGNVGDPVIQPNAEKLAEALGFGQLAQYAIASATPGSQAFGIPNKPTRFCEMLIEALDGAGAISKLNGQWMVDHRGIEAAIRSYAQRTPDLADPEFYTYVSPISSDLPKRMYLRKTAHPPKSYFVAYSKPKPALKKASIKITQLGSPAPIWEKTPAARAKLHIELPPRVTYKVSAVFDGNVTKEVEIFADLPQAEPDEQEFVI